LLCTVLSLLFTCTWFWLYPDVGQKSGGNTLGWAVQWQMLEVPESHGMTCTATLRNRQLMPSLIMLSSTGGRSLCGTRQNGFKSKGFNDWVHQLISFLKEILSYTWPWTINQAHTWHAQLLLQDRPLCVFWKFQGGGGKSVSIAWLFVFHSSSYSSLAEV